MLISNFLNEKQFLNFPSDLVGSSSVTSVNFTRDGQCIVVGLTSGEPVRLFDKSTGEMLQEYLGNKNESGYRIEAVLDHTDRRILAGKTICLFFDEVNRFYKTWELLYMSKGL